MHEQSPDPRENDAIELPDFYEDQLLRREAGADWKFEEPEPRLFGLLIAREIIIESMTNAGIRPPAKDSEKPGEPVPIYDEYLALVQRIDALKEELDVATPPPLPLEQEDRYTT